MLMSDRIAIMRDGKIVQIGRPRELYASPNTRFVASFLGKSNFIEGKVTAVEAGVAVVDTVDGAVQHRLRKNEDTLSTGSHAVLALRPQKVHLKPGANVRTGRVTSAVFLGTHAEVTLKCNSGNQLLAQFVLPESASLPEEGSEVSIGWDAESTISVISD
jgi:ABC-type Fe3+/spermidine/putrescine transport system ATPase subunit